MRRAAFVAAMLSSFVTPLMSSTVNVALPRIGAEFGMDAVLLGWVATAYSLAAGVFLVPFGRLSDILGRKRVFSVGLGLYAATSLLIGLANSAALVIAFRAAQGVGAAMIFGTGVAILTSVYPASDRGRVLGFNSAAVYTGLSIGPFIGGVLVEQLGWRSIFLLSVPLSLAALIYTVWSLRAEWAGAAGESFDLRGSLVYGVAVVALMYGFSRLPEALGGWLIALGLAAGVVFLWWERRVDRPVLDLELFRQNRVFAFSSLAALINYGATAAVAFLLSLYLQYIGSLTPKQAGTVLIAQPIVQALLSPLAGRLSDRTEPRVVASIGMAITALGLTLLALLGPASSLSYVIVCLLLLGLGFAFFSSPNASAIMGAVERRYYGVASGLMSTMRTFGQMLAMGLALLLFALYMGRVAITPDYYPQFLASVKTTFGISAGFCVLGIFVSLARGRREQVGTPSSSSARPV
ncbi:MAG: MFS transporter [Anaerolineae bacterium]|nr:MFS transporter [Anaerolineae bacterium]